MNTVVRRVVNGSLALILGSGLASVYALDPTDFNNNGVVTPTSDQYENNGSNNANAVQILPKGFTITKTADASGVATPTLAGNQIIYSIQVENIGLLPLTNIQVSDSLIPAAGINLLSGDVNSNSILDADEIWNYEASYSITQSDIDSNGGGDGDVDNTASVTANELTSISDSAEVAISQAPDFTVAKVVDQASIGGITTLNYTITVENTGNQSLNNINLVDTLPDNSTGTLTGPTADIGILGALDVNESWQYQVSYLVSQTEIDAGATLTNSVVVTTAETGSTVKSANADTVIVQTPQFTVTKNVTPAAITVPTLLNYDIEIANTGNTSLTGLNLQDVLPGGSSASLVGPTTDIGTPGVLDVSEVWVFTTDYSATQLDVDSGNDLVNQISVTALETGASIVSDDATTTISQTPAMLVTKTVDTAAIAAPGVVNYAISVLNTGNVSLTNIVLNDVLPDAATGVLSGPVSDIGTVGAIDVNEQWDFTTSYNVTQADIDAGLPLVNRIDVQSSQTGTTVYTDNATTTVNQNPGMLVTKVVDQSVVTTPGTLSYVITVENTGNVSLTGITPNDQLPDGSVGVLAGPVADTGLSGAIDVAETWSYTTTYEASQADIDAGIPLANTVSVSSNETGTLGDSAVTNVTQAPAIQISKSSVDTNYVREGDVINYTFTVQNTGNVVLNSVIVTDPNADVASLICAQAMPFNLGIAESIGCTALHTITVADVQATQVVNIAEVTANDPQDNSIGDTSDPVVVAMTQVPPVATNDSLSSLVSAVAVTLPGTVNDSDDNFDINVSATFLVDANALDTDSDGDADTLTVPGEGVWTVDNATGEITFTPQNGFTADPTPIEYQIVDDTGLVSNLALLTIDYPQSRPVAQDDYQANPAVPSPSNPTSVAVLSNNGSGPDSDPENDLNPLSIALSNSAAVDASGDGYADTLVVAGEGVWTVDVATGLVTFTPEAGFMADPTPVSYTVQDSNGLVSNEALITVDYPQRAPVTADDEMGNQPLGQPVVVSVLANDYDLDGNIDPTTVQIINPADGSYLSALTVPGEGVWTVDANTGTITFVAQFGFVGSPTPINYVVSDTTGLVSNPSKITVLFEEPAALEGIVWLDADRDGQIDPDEDRKAGWTLRVLDSNGVLVGTAVTDADGAYSVTGLIPGEYTIEFYNELGVYMDSAVTRPLVAGEVYNFPLPVDPGGIVYDSLTRLPVEGVTLALVDVNDQPIDASCLAANQQNQVTAEDGLYAFHLTPGAHSSCPLSGSYKIELVDTPANYHSYFSALIRQEGAAGCGGPSLACAVSGVFDAAADEINCTIDTLPGTNACEVQRQPEPPQNGEDTRYYVEFNISAGDTNIVFNHLPLDSRENDAEILITKSVDRRQASIGDLVSYTVTLENTKDVAALQLSVVDAPPAGFSFIDTSAQLIRRGPDATFDTADDVIVALGSAGLNPVVFNDFDLEGEEIVQLRYVARVGTGVVTGKYINLVYAQNPTGVASNEATASVEIISDPVLNQATLIGKVFHDRDSDGTQDSANATDVVLRSDFYGWNSLGLGSIPGRRTVNDDPAETAITVNMPLGDKNHFAIRTREGTRISVDENGTITEAHVGIKARGMSSQDIRVCTSQSVAIPTPRAGDTASTEASDVLEIVLTNHGINEEGIPAARLATVTGLVIETDAFGRYSIPDVELGSDGLGRNFVLKVDPASLPNGSEFTTENPYVLRIVNSTLNKINFGVNYPERDRFTSAKSNCIDTPAIKKSVEVALGSVFFDVGRADVRKDQIGIVRDIISKLNEYGGGRITINSHTDSDGSAASNVELANRRAATIRRILLDSLGTQVMKNVTVEVSPQADAEAKQ